MYFKDIKICEPKEKHTATVIFLHGYGERASDWINFLANEVPPYVKIVCPQAPDMVTFESNVPQSAWFDLQKEGVSFKFDRENVQTATSHITNLIRNEITNGIPSERIVLGGFSLGGSIAIDCGFRTDLEFAGIVTFGSFLVDQAYCTQLTQEKKNKKTQVLMIHGSEDPIVPLYAAQYSLQLVSKVFKKPIFRLHQDLSHVYDKKVIEQIGKFIRTRLPLI